LLKTPPQQDLCRSCVYDWSVQENTECLKLDITIKPSIMHTCCEPTVHQQSKRVQKFNINVGRICFAAKTACLKA